MTSKDRVKKTLRFDNPDMIPLDYWILPATRLKYGAELQRLLDAHPKDFPETEDSGGEYAPPPNYRKGDYTDCFGSLWHQEIEGMIGIVSKPPLEDFSLLETYKFPAPEDGETTLEQIANLAAQPAAREKFLCVDFIRTFERMHFMRGLEPLLMDMAYQKRDFFALLEKVAEWNISHVRRVLDETGGDIDGVWFSDDWGTQKSLLIRPAVWRETFKPWYAKMFAPVKSRGKAVFFHSDGFIMDIIPDLIEVGVDALNCQVMLLGPKELSARFGGAVTFHTDMDRQRVLPFGTPREIEDDLDAVVENLGRRPGGLILCAEIGPDMPFGNIRALFEGFEKARRKTVPAH